MVIQVRSAAKNDIGEHVTAWADAQTLVGFLDLCGGNARYAPYNAKIQESTHVFLSDYAPLDSRITAESARAVIAGKPYDITLIDNPMGLNRHLEIYLKYTGGQ